MTELVLQDKIRDVCIRLLTRREHSQQELLEKLALRGFERVDSENMVNTLAEQGLQSDLRFAESYARYRIKNGFGPIKIQFELMQRGIKNFDLDNIVIDIVDDWIEVLQILYYKKYSDESQLDLKEWHKRSRFLQQRGFSSQMIKVFFKQLNIQINYS